MSCNDYFAECCGCCSEPCSNSAVIIYECGMDLPSGCYIYVNLTSTSCLSCDENCAIAIGSGDISASIIGECPFCNPYLDQDYWAGVSDGQSICPILEGGDCTCVATNGCFESGGSFRLYLYDKKKKKFILNNNGIQVYYDIIKRRQKNLNLGPTKENQFKIKPIVREVSKKKFL